MRSEDARRLNQRVQRYADGSLEHWRDVPGYQGHARVSDWGRVKRLDRDGRLRVIEPYRGIYPWVSLRTPDGCWIRFSVHVLVLSAFIGPRPNGLIACHYDGNPSNNHLSNLRWDTWQGNMEDDYRNGTRKRPIPRVRRAKGKVSEIQVREIRKLYSTGDYTLSELGRIYAVTLNNIWCIVRRKSWKHVP